MSNGTTPPPAQNVPGTSQPVSGQIHPQGTAQHYSMEAPPEQAKAEPQIPENVQQELAELRAFREQAGPVADLVSSMGGESLYQHYANYANLLEQQRQQQSQPEPKERRESRDPWAGDGDDETPEITKLREDLVAARREIDAIRNNFGTDKVRAHSERFFQKEYPDLTPEERDKINKGMEQAVRTYSQTEQGRAFLQNPDYNAVRALALRHLPPEMLEEVYRRKFERERTQRSSLSTDAYRPSQPGAEGVDYGDDFLSAWNASGEAVRREGLI